MTGSPGRFPVSGQWQSDRKDGKIIGSELIGQNFASDGYLPWPALRHDRHRSERCDQDRAGALQREQFGGVELWSHVEGSRRSGEGATPVRWRRTNPSAKIPIDLVTTSASGLDPDITPAAALFQVPRVAAARGLPEDKVRHLVEDHVTGRLLGIWANPMSMC